jgi:hypothetical protein
MNEFAIVNLLFKSELYLIGSCISGYIHQQYRKKYGLKFDIILLVDEIIYKYKNHLENFFDKIILIDIIPIKLSQKYINMIPEKYTKTMDIFTTKLNIFKLHQYKKVLFLDIDIIPVNKNFYNIFTYNTPATTINNINNNNTKNIISKNDVYTNSINISNLNYTINGGVILISPTENDFENIIKFMHEQEGTDGYTSFASSGPDETIILNYYLLNKNMKWTNIDKNYSIIPWEKDYKKYFESAYSINYLSNIKPWNKPLFMMWKEEFIFYLLVNKIISNDNLLKIIHYRNIAKIISTYDKSIKDGNLTQRCYKNLDIKNICVDSISLINNDDKLKKLIVMNNDITVYENLDKDLINKLSLIFDVMNSTKFINITEMGEINNILAKFHSSMIKY